MLVDASIFINKLSFMDEMKRSGRAMRAGCYEKGCGRCGGAAG
jgi:hypothetical protein